MCGFHVACFVAAGSLLASARSARWPCPAASGPPRRSSRPARSRRCGHDGAGPGQERHIGGSGSATDGPGDRAAHLGVGADSVRLTRRRRTSSRPPRRAVIQPTRKRLTPSSDHAAVADGLDVDQHRVALLRRPRAVGVGRVRGVGRTDGVVVQARRLGQQLGLQVVVVRGADGQQDDADRGGDGGDEQDGRRRAPGPAVRPGQRPDHREAEDRHQDGRVAQPGGERALRPLDRADRALQRDDDERVGEGKGHRHPDHGAPGQRDPPAQGRETYGRWARGNAGRHGHLGTVRCGQWAVDTGPGSPVPAPGRLGSGTGTGPGRLGESSPGDRSPDPQVHCFVQSVHYADNRDRVSALRPPPKMVRAPTPQCWGVPGLGSADAGGRHHLDGDRPPAGRGRRVRRRPRQRAALVREHRVGPLGDRAAGRRRVPDRVRGPVPRPAAGLHLRGA